MYLYPPEYVVETTEEARKSRKGLPARYRVHTKYYMYHSYTDVLLGTYPMVHV